MYRIQSVACDGRSSPAGQALHLRPHGSCVLRGPRQSEIPDRVLLLFLSLCCCLFAGGGGGGWGGGGSISHKQRKQQNNNNINNNKNSPYRQENLYLYMGHG